MTKITTLETKRMKLPSNTPTLVAGDEPGTFKGYGAMFGNKDRDGDIVLKGAFSESLKARKPVLLWQHDTKEPIGSFDVVKEDDQGLWVEGRLSMKGKGREVYELLKMGAVNGLSIGFVAKEAVRDAGTGTRKIKRADLMEISVVTFPANESARVTEVKSDGAVFGIETPRAFERFLREYGFSRSRAKAITAKGYKETKQTEICDLITSLNERRLMLETKDTRTVDVKAGVSHDFWFSPKGPIVRIHVSGSGGAVGGLNCYAKYRKETNGEVKWVQQTIGRTGTVEIGKIPYSLRNMYPGSFKLVCRPHGNGRLTIKVD